MLPLYASERLQLLPSLCLIGTLLSANDSLSFTIGVLGIFGIVSSCILLSGISGTVSAGSLISARISLSVLRYITFVGDTTVSFTSSWGTTFVSFILLFVPLSDSLAIRFVSTFSFFRFIPSQIIMTEKITANKPIMPIPTRYSVISLRNIAFAWDN